MEAAQSILQQIKKLKSKVEEFKGLEGQYDDAVTLTELAISEDDESVYPEARTAADAFIQGFERLRIAALLSGEYDRNNAILTLHSGAGGTEACDWTSMLYRMYLRYAEKSGFSAETLDYLDGDEAGIKSVTILISGENAYGYLKCEKGIHRLIRLSPFDAAGKRHTSFASCDVMPELDDSITVDIKDEDLRIDTYRASGAGGQHVNRTDSAIRITHLPTGIVVSCQNERSQHKNRESAMKMLKSKLFAVKQAERDQLLTGVRGDVKDINFGSQIRTYTFHPYSLAKDHRTGVEAGTIQAVMDGGISPFINAYLMSKANL
jgi:peptide chain release factor 2